ncbi:homeobox protein MSX-2 [Trichogramma pretiosum]|uniref:homeobox protein MSX-2 n=1 Tax=Trichogramma pretiosum TaxID=7493 RepID=UPI0006C9A820|nr:homeobox protein MSX-2 [Trichogramma pretiosum]
MQRIIFKSTIDPSKKKEEQNLKNVTSEELTWLRCTRYRPPKLPRKSSANKRLKRKPGSHPRIPFTTYQLETLENKYKTSAYLSRKDVVHLSELLNLPQSRIKIWFQNRRARERREFQITESLQST